MKQMCSKSQNGRVTIHTSCRVHKSWKPSKLCLPGSHYLSSFRELSKSICIVFLFQNFRDLAPELRLKIIRSEVLRSKVQFLKCVHRSKSSRKFINASCIVYVGPWLISIFHVDIKITFKKTKKTCEFCTAFLKCVLFKTKNDLYSVCSLPLYR